MEFFKQEKKKAHLEYDMKNFDFHRSRWETGDWTDDSDQMILILLSLLDNDGKVSLHLHVFTLEAQWPHDKGGARLLIKQSRFELWPGTLCCVLEQHTYVSTLTVPLFTQVYNWILANLKLEITLGWTSIPSRRE